MQSVPEYAHEYSTVAESTESSTCRELLGVLRCLQSMVHLCECKLVVFQVDAQNLIGIVNRGSTRLKLNALERELFWFGLERRITLSVEWVPREKNTLADELSKLLIPDDCSLNRKHLVSRRTGGRVGCMHSLTIGAGKLLGYTAPIGWWAGFGGSCITTGW